MKLTAREIACLEYAIAHMLDDSEEDQTCAEVLKELVLRHNIEPVQSWWFDIEPCTDLQDANDQMIYMREDWQKMGEALGFEEFVDPEVMINRAQILRNMS